MLHITPESVLHRVYQAYADFHDIMDLTEGIIQHVKLKATKVISPVIYIKELKSKSANRLNVYMVDAIKEITGVDLKDMTFEEAKAIAAERSSSVEKHYIAEVGHIINALKNLLKKH